jgi:hypothetical protein
VAAQWMMSDAWVFSSIDGTGPDDGYTLAQVIAKADGINHAILTEAEFTQAVARLVAAGLIGAQAEADRYWHTEAGRVLYRQRMKRRGLFGWIDAIPPVLRRRGEPRTKHGPCRLALSIAHARNTAARRTPWPAGTTGNAAMKTDPNVPPTAARRTYPAA